MTCRNCSQPLPANTSTCIYCGYPITDAPKTVDNVQQAPIAPSFKAAPRPQKGMVIMLVALCMATVIAVITSVWILVSNNTSAISPDTVDVPNSDSKKNAAVINMSSVRGVMDNCGMETGLDPHEVFFADPFVEPNVDVDSLSGRLVSSFENSSISFVYLEFGVGSSAGDFYKAQLNQFLMGYTFATVEDNTDGTDYSPSYTKVESSDSSFFLMQLSLPFPEATEEACIDIFYILYQVDNKIMFSKFLYRPEGDLDAKKYYTEYYDFITDVGVPLEQLINESSMQSLPFL